MNKTAYVCKYTPVELLKAFGGKCEILNHMPQGFDVADQYVGANICGFGKTVIEDVAAGKVKELVLVNCCDTIKSVYDVLEASHKLDFIFFMDLPHDANGCGRMVMKAELMRLAEAYGSYKGTTFSKEKFAAAFQRRTPDSGDHIAVLGARMGNELYKMAAETMPIKVRNYSCVNSRTVTDNEVPETTDFEELMDWYAAELLAQFPCMRMTDSTGRRQVLEAPGLKGIIYHTVRFCDFYGFEYAALNRENKSIPLIKIESDYTTQSEGQMRTRLEAFREELGFESTESKRKTNKMGKGFFAGIDSGSTSTDVAILDKDKNMIAGIIIPTGAGAAISAENALQQALKKAGLAREDIDNIVTTGYGRDVIQSGDRSITEITCHAKGAHFLDPSVRTVIDIGGQDSKAIHLDENGNVLNFAMNDKCAAGTGRFLDMMSHTMQMSLDEMSQCGLTYDEDITISSMCSVFAESEVVSLIAANKKKDDIVHGINKAVAVKTAALVKRVGGESCYMMTGGVSKNKGLVKTLSEHLGEPITISEDAQLCGAIGAALFAIS